MPGNVLMYNKVSNAQDMSRNQNCARACPAASIVNLDLSL